MTFTAGNRWLINSSRAFQRRKAVDRAIEEEFNENGFPMAEFGLREISDAIGTIRQRSHRKTSKDGKRVVLPLYP